MSIDNLKTILNAIKYLLTNYIANGDKAIILTSSTPDSTKKFKITVDDSGVPSFTNTEDSTEVWAPSDAPTKTSQLENDAGYLTLATLPKYGGEVV